MLISIGRGITGPTKKSNVKDISLKGVVSSCVFDLDATIVASYAGSGQKWANLVSTPADGSAKAAYDFALGATTSASTDDPTFTGSAGSTSAYFSFDGGDSFQLTTTTNFIKKIQRSDQTIASWGAIAFRHIADGVQNAIMGTSALTSELGFRLIITATERLQLAFRGDSAQTNTNAATGPLLTTDTDYLVIWSWDGTNCRFWVNSGTKQVFALAVNTCVNDCTNVMGLGCARDGQTRLPNTSRVYAVSMGNGFIDDTQAALIISAYNTRHGRTYA